MNKTESYCYQKYKSSSNNSCVTKEKNIVGKNLLEGTYFDGNGIPKMIGITKDEYLEYKQLQQENKQLKEQLSVAQTNEETFRLEMEDITKTLGLDENTLFDDVKVCVKNLIDNWNELRKWIVYNKHNENTEQHYLVVDYGTLLGKMNELQGSDDSNGRMEKR